MNQTQTRSLRKKVLSLILAVVMVVSLLPISAFASGDSKASTADNTDYYKILHLDCGRKYFSKDWIIALLNEMSADGYNQLQLAFGNDGLRFLLDDMSFTANGTTYSHKTVVSKVEAGNKLQNNSGDARWLTQTEMDEIIAAAKEKGIEIVPLLNLPGHANTILDIADNNTYNAKIYGTVSQNTLDVTNDAACNFGYEIFKKYVDYFSSKGCKYFNFGADEYGNDTGDKNPHFDVLKGTGYENLSTFINKLAAYIGSKNMTPRTFNDALYYNKGSWDMQTTTNTAIKTIQCCYWSSGWGSYPVAEASTIVSNGHAMINTNGAYYYVLGKDDAFTPGETKVHDAGQYTAAAKFDNTAFASGTVNNPVGSMFCIWSDFPNAETETQVAQNVRLVMRAMALRMDGKSINGMGTGVIQNGFNVDGTLNVGSTGSVTERTITVAVGGTKTVTADGYYNGSYATEDTTIATASAVGTAAVDRTENEVTTIESGKQYLIVHKRSGLVLNDSTSGNGILLGEKANSSDQLWTITKYSSSNSNAYTIQGVAENYITEIGNGSATLGTSNGYVQMAYNSNGYWNIYDKPYWTSLNYYYLNQYGGASSTMAAGHTANGASDDGSQWQIYQVTPGTKATTTITFNGVSKGTTTVTIGDVTYKIHVVAEDLSKVTPLKLEYWITNAPIDSVTGAGSESRDKVLKSEAYKVYFTNIAAQADGVASPDGVDVTTIAPANTSHDNRTVYYWRCRMLDTTLANNSTSMTQQQTADGGDDETMSGVGFTKIRYYGSSWQVFTENNEWVTVDTDKNQLIAYYLEYIKVSDEVESFAADWGNRGDGSKGGWLDKNNYCTLSMQVVYEDGTTNPTNTTASALKSKTIVYGYWNDKNGRGIGTIMLDGQEYEIYKVTSETGAATASFSGYDATVTNFDWDGNERTVWEGDASSSVSIHNDATGFSTEGANANLCWDENKEAILLRVYVRAKVTEDSLTVNYYDESNTTLPFYSYNIAVASGTTFNNDFAYSNGRLINNTVTNIKNVTQTVNWKLEEMSEIGAQYRYSDYTFTNANKETGNKVVNLYYKFKTEKTFVVDFGLPLHIEKTDINPTLANANITEVAVGKSLYATINANADYSIDYILNKTIDGSDRVTVTYSGTNKDTGKDDSATYNLTVIPATSVYYEDSFATFTNANGTKNVAQVDNADKGIWTKVTDGTTQTNVNQALEELGGTTNTKNVYGYDQAYANSSKFSMGSATKVTVDANTANNAQWPTATFTFKGTGFDVISLTDNNSGAISVKVYSVGSDGTKTQVKGTLVNNYYGYTYADGKWEAAPTDKNNALYQVPVIKISDLPYGTYEVVITVSYATFADKTNDHQYSFWLDAIRVYDPAGATLDTEYAKDNEKAPNYVEVKKVILDSKALETAGATGAVFIDGKGANGVTAADYKNQGPNHEAYLADGQAIAFQLIASAEPTSVQIGAKLASGNSAGLQIGGAACAKASNGTLTLNTATDMYYALTDMGWTLQNDGTYRSKVITLTNAGSGIISLTNLKFIGAKYTGSLAEVKSATSETNLVTLAVSSEMIDEALTAVDGALNPAPETFEPSHFEADWNRSVRAGQKATLTVKTSEDVDAITVDGQTITTYRTRTERTGWGWWSPRVTYRVFTYTTTAQATADYEVCALNSDSVASEPITATLTVKPAINWWHKWF